MNLAPNSTTAFLREVFTADHWHLCPACEELYDCNDRRCINEESVWCEPCYSIAEEAAGC